MYSIAALLFFLNELFYGDPRRKPAAKTASSDRNDAVARFLTTLLSASALVFLLALSLSLIRHAAVDPSSPPAFADLPIPAVNANELSWASPYRMNVSLRLFLTNIAASIALYCLYRSLSTEKIKHAGWGVIITAYAISMFLALHASVLDSTDVYRYAVQGMLGLQAYAAHPLSIPCSDSQPDAWCKQHDFIRPTFYGPLFLLYLHVLLSRTASIFSDIAVLRLAGAAWTTLFIVFLFLLRVKPATIAVAALNPVFFMQYVGDAHNDIICIVFITAGALAVQRFPFLTLLFTLTASLIKFPFALIGLMPFSRLPPRPRILWATASLSAFAVISAAWYGKTYGRSTHLAWYLLTGNHIAATVLAVLLIGIALVYKRIYLAAAYLLPTFTPLPPMPWYAIWALPYVQEDAAKLAIFLILLPPTSFLFNINFTIPVLGNTIIGILLIACFIQIWRRPARCP